MAEVSFCPKCGASVKPDFQFCTSCGFALLTIKEPPSEKTEEKAAAVVTVPAENITPVQPQPAVTTTTVMATPVPVPVPPPTGNKAPLFSPQVHMIIIAVILAGLGFWIWSMEKDKNGGSPGTYLPDTGDTTKDDQHLPPISFPGDQFAAADFTGVWRAYESISGDQLEEDFGDPDDDLFIEYTNDLFVLYPRSEKGKDPSAVFTCSEVVGKLVTCDGRGTGSDAKNRFVLKMELNDSKTEMTISIIHEDPSESIVVKARKL